MRVEIGRPGNLATPRVMRMGGPPQGARRMYAVIRREKRKSYETNPIPFPITSRRRSLQRLTFRGFTPPPIPGFSTG
jgi:hypothetical protein